MQIGTLPVNQIPRFHQYQPPVVASSVLFSVAFPFRIALSVTLSVNVQIGHRQIEGAIRATEDMRVADTFLFGYRISGYDGFPFVQGGKSIAARADCHAKPMVFVFTEDHQISGTTVRASGYATLIFANPELYRWVSEWTEGEKEATLKIAANLK